MKLGIKICLSVAFLFVLTANSSAQVYQNIPAAIHIQSNVSDGKYSFPDIVKTAQEKGIEILIFTDTVLRRWEYGLRPFENIIIRRIEHNSVFRFGIKKYLETLGDIQRSNPDMIIVPAVEVVPFYYWVGNFYDGSLTLFDWHKQLIVIGLEKTQDLRFLPIIANYSWIPRNKINMRRLWPILLIILGIFTIKRHPRRASYRQLGYSLLVIGILFLINNIHFNVSRFDAYSGDQRIKPYQDLIDYVNKKNGLVFWSHPEVKNLDRVKDVNICTDVYKDDLLYTSGYVGSAMLFDGNRSLAKIGDIWDKILIDSCLGRRKPIWAIGEVDYDGKGRELASIETIFLLQDLSQAGVIDALKSGKMYSQLNSKENDFSLVEFKIFDEQKQNFAFMGDEIEITSRPQISIQTSCSSHADEPIKILLIRNGELINEFVSENPDFQIKFQDDYFNPGETIYYRIMINAQSNSYQVISNPIFVKFAK